MELLREKRDWGRTPKVADEAGRYRCSRCREWKAPEEFNRNRTQVSGLNYACRECIRTYARKYTLPTKYGISAEKFADMLLAQDDRCACCGKQFSIEARMDRACVDHNHISGEVRDLLCGRCNLAAGIVADSSDIAERLVAYLKSWNC